MTHTRTTVRPETRDVDAAGPTRAAQADAVIDACADLRSGIVLVRDVERMGGDRKLLAREHDTGALVRLRRGAYVPEAVWARSDGAARHLLHVRSAALMLPGQVFSHWSAAALLRLPRVGAWPDQVHTFRDQSSGGRSTAGVVRHCDGGDPDRLVVGEAVCTAHARTVLDLARVDSFAGALAAGDAALRSGAVTAADLRRELSEHPARRRRRQMERVVRHVDARSGSVGESLSRARMIELGAPEPELQVELRDDAGLVGRVDFLWRGLGVVGELDGREKDERAEMLRGRTGGPALWDEKRREDRIRRLGLRIVRWTWGEALDRTTFAGMLRASGILRG